MNALPPASPKPSRAAWRDARDLLWVHRGRLAAGFGLLVVSRVAALVLPASSKYLIDEVITRHNAALLGPLAFAVVVASFIQAGAALYPRDAIGERLV